MRKQLVFCDVCEEPFSGDCIPLVFNGTDLDVCGHQCFLKFWSQRYEAATKDKHTIQVKTGIQVVKAIAK